MKNLSLVFFLLFLAASTSVFAQISVDNTSSLASTGQQSNISWSHTVGSGNNRLLVVTLSAYNPSAQGVNSIKFNGVNLTQLTSKSTPSTYTEMWYLLNPPTGTYTINVSYQKSQAVAGAVSFYGVDQSIPFGTTASASGS